MLSCRLISVLLIPFGVFGISWVLMSSHGFSWVLSGFSWVLMGSQWVLRLCIFGFSGGSQASTPPLCSQLQPGPGPTGHDYTRGYTGGYHPADPPFSRSHALGKNHPPSSDMCVTKSGVKRSLTQSRRSAGSLGLYQALVNNL